MLADALNDIPRLIPVFKMLAHVNKLATVSFLCQMLLCEFCALIALFQKHFDEFMTFLGFICRLVDEFLTPSSPFSFKNILIFSFDVFAIVQKFCK